MATPATARPHERGAKDVDTSDEFRLLATLEDGPVKEQIRRRVITAWLPMAHRLAYRLRERGEHLDDLKQVAALGLVKAVDRFDPDRADAFEQFAVPTITGELKRHFRDHTWHVHVPRRIQELRNKVRLAVKELSTTLDGRTPGAEQIAAHTGLSEQDVTLGLRALESYRSLSLDAALDHGGEGGDEHTLLHVLGALEDAFALVEDRETVKPVLARLPERDRRILYLRFFEDMTQSAIAAELGVSQMHVSRLLNRALARIRTEATRTPAGQYRKAA
ncbi:RNA polymerase sigma factor [Streptomyces chrestomyceticus JCM 4735]|uniref:RNA polymerase sigma factor n=1 Tax=Streptomyces chrestomyceticus JCM 4735 TaxID=1306181 RepID=A0A7U9PVT4_9ACTN|nr:SigB/SigF/SigG family RNA polymerase sigma factor [Streptomyces chrestomyceticus]GCD32870.1 RNA polymerase sigma factor [Streptomyces chrestomyceticus JCM 4735]